MSIIGRVRRVRRQAANDLPLERKFTVTPDDLCVRDHRVNGVGIVPGVVLMEMARAAAQGAGVKLACVRDIAWIRPVIVQEQVELRVRLARDDGWRFEILGPGDALHASGRFEEPHQTPPAPVDVRALRDRLTEHRPAVECYARFRGIGIEYGPAFQCIEELGSTGEFALATLSRQGTATGADWERNAPLLDATLQSISALAGTLGEGLPLPFALGALHFYRDVPQRGYAYARRNPSKGPVQSYSILLLDQAGNVCVAFDDFSVKAAEPPRKETSEPLTLLRPVWRDAPLFEASAAHGQALIVTSEAGMRAAEQIALGHAGAKLVHAPADWDRELERLPDLATIYFLGSVQAQTLDLASLETGQREGVFALLGLSQALERRALLQRPIVLKVLTAGPAGAESIGFALALAKEYTRLQVSCIDVELEAGRLSDASLRAVIAEPGGGACVRVRAGKRQVRSMQRLSAPDSTSSPWRKQGVYLIAGGAGGIGAELAEHLGRQVQARVALLGRRPEDDAIRGILQRVQQAGGTAMYVQADIADPNAVEQAVARVRAAFGPIHGVVHSALALEDRTLVNLDEACLRAVLAPKVRGSVVLERATAGEPLDLFLAFSSSQALTGNSGQANYAAACTFQDAFIEHLHGSGKRAHTINWGFWGTVGRVASEQYRRNMAKLGIFSIEKQEGMAAIESVLRGGLPQVAAVKASARALGELGMADGPDAMERVREQVTSALPHLFESPDIEANAGEIAALEAYAAWSLREVIEREPGLLAAAAPKFARACESLRFVLAKAPRVAARPDSPRTSAHVRLLDACVASLGPILRGELPATDVLFPAGKMDLVEGVYRGSPISDAFNRLVGTAARSCVEARGRACKILEVGAGTGGTTAAVLDALAALGGAIEYCYTDVSPQFMRHGRTRFAGRLPGLRFAVLNIERDPVAQGFEAGSFDLILGANVMHATRRIDLMLANLKRLLRQDGLVLLNEATAFHVFTALTFGLLDGWWLFEDAGLRIPHTPLLSVGSWRGSLEAAGFGQVCDFTHGNLPHAVLIAENSADRTAVVAPANPVQRTSGEIATAIVKIVSAAIEIDAKEIDPALPFTDFGIDSIMAVDIVTRISEHFDVGLRATDLFNYSTIEQLAEHIAGLAPHVDEPVRPGRPAIQDDAPSPSQGLDVFDMLTPAPTLEIPPAPAKPVRATDIAVIGMSGRFPGARTLEAFWENLAAGRDSITEMPADRFDSAAVYSPERNRPGKTYSKWGGFVDDPDAFDPLFFNISPREAVQMDPQQRLFLEEAWLTFEDAGYPADRLEGCRCGVFLGGGANDYKQRLQAAGLAPEAFTFMGNAGSILAARISFFLNLKGPAIAIDTACSSSLMAIHLACESLRNGACELALAGGVSVLSTPAFHISASRAGMLSPQGRCKTFDHSADGFVPAEAVGAVLLKPLAKALADGDRIYAVIKGSASNQDGRTNGITAPSGPSQTALEREVYDRFDISPETITLVECHGTGTRLGDPIEVDALTDAFRHYTDRTGFCALSSVKANIGHTLAAAGIASFLKAVLCLQQERIPPSVHFEQPNEHFDLESGPFFVPRTLIPWKDRGADSARRAAISSFGFSGTNVHVVLEAAPREKAVTAPQARQPWHLVTVSAKSEEALRAMLQRLDAWLAQNEGARLPDISLHDISYTLLHGRAHFPVRAAMVARDVDDLSQRVREAAWIRSAQTAEPESADLTEPGLRLLAQLRAGLLSEAQRHEKLAELADLYARGADLPWEDLAPLQGARLIRLPGYAFARDRYAPEDAHWHPEKPAPVYTNGNGANGNAEHRFTTLLEPAAFPLAEHIVAGQAVLPGVAYLEMARAAGEQAYGQAVGALRNLVWMRPITAREQAVTVHTSVRNGGETTLFEVWSGENSQPLIHARGQIVFSGSVNGGPKFVDLEAVRGRCAHRLEASALYRRAEDLNLHLGPALRTVQGVVFNGVEALSVLRLAHGVNGNGNGSSGYVLHPALLDGALQSLMCFLPANEARLHVPFALEEVRIYGPVPETCYVHARCLDNGTAHRSFDVSIADESGRVCVDLRKLSARAFAPAKVDAAAAPGVHYYRPVRTLGEPLDGPTIERIPPEAADSFESMFAFLRGLALDPPKQDRRFAFVCREGDPTHEALAALLATAEREIPHVRFVPVSGPDLRPVRTTWQPYQPGAAALSLSADGVYLVTGGLGHIGRRVVSFLAEHGARRIVLCGRQTLTPEGKRYLDELTRASVAAAYFSADLGCRDQVFDLIARLKRRFGPLRGIIHTAAVTRDALLVNKTLEQARAVLAPKVSGALNLDEATRQEPLEHFVLFSSMAALRGNPGQADYAYANAFLDRFAETRQGPGRTCAIDWPLWREGGLRVSDRAAEHLAQSAGLLPLETSAALDALAHALTKAPARFLVMQGDAAKFERALNGTETPTETPEVQSILHRLAAEALKLAPEKLDPRRHLAEFGMDSITFVELTERINLRLGLDLSPAIFFEHPSVKQLADHLLTQVLPQARVEQPAPATVEVAVPEVAPEVAAARVPERAAVSFAPPENQPIAIIGMDGVLPGSKDLREFWQHLRQGDDMITEIPADRWDWREYFGDPAKEPNRTNSKWGGFMPEVDKFDARFFGISPREAGLMDPQHRIFLEVAWHAIENAGWRPSDLAGTRTGVFVGAGHSDYEDLVRQSGIAIEAHSATGMSNAMLANRISFLLDLHGPSEPVDTACSSSLVALHRAAESIRRGECDMAIAGGVYVMLSPAPYIAFGKAGMLSDDGRCRTFDANANGYVRGEGAGAVFLKRLDLALADGDPIIALLLGSAVNHGGRASSLTAPNPRAQTDLLVRAFAAAHVTPASIGYIEAHGTGTRLGDPVEIEGLKAAFAAAGQARSATEQASPHCGLASVKTNIGHLETAAGIAGVLKVLLSMRHRQLPANVHFEKLNPYVRMDGSPFYIVDRTRPWEPLPDENGRAVLRAGCSSFGFGGANAHVVLEAVESAPAGEVTSPVLVVLSAKNDERLRDMVRQLLAFLEQPDEHAALADVAFTLMLGREEMESRLALVVSSRDELRSVLRGLTDNWRALPANAWRNDVRETNEGLGFLRDDEDAAELLERWTRKGKLGQVAKLWLAGVPVDWRKLPQLRGRRRVALPGYPFARDRHWFSAPPRPATFSPGQPFIRDHVIGGKAIVPGAALIEAIDEKLPGKELHRHTWVAPLILDAPARIDVTVTESGQASARYEVRHGGVLLAHGTASPLESVAGNRDPQALEAELPYPVDAADIDRALAAAGFAYGPTYRGWKHICRSGDRALGLLHLEAAEHRLAIALTSAFQLLAAFPRSGQAAAKTWAPHRVERVTIASPIPVDVYALVERHGETRADVSLIDLNGTVCASLIGVELAALPTPAGSSLARAVADLQPQSAEVNQLAEIMRPLDGLEPFLDRLLMNGLARLGLFAAPKPTGNDAELAATLGIPAEHRRLFSALLAVASASAPVESLDDLEREKDRLSEAHPTARAHLRLAWACAQKLPDILTGRVPATEVLFPNSSLELVDPVYRGNPLADFNNRLAAAAISRYVDGVEASIIEIGAGTGGTTDEVLRTLAAHQQSPRYLFTDVSRAFVKHGRARFGELYPFAEFEALDIERDPAAQGFACGQFDIVLAANVLHATRDIAKTVRHVRALLKPGGWLVLNEINRSQAFTTLTFGLLGGWWLFEDSARRLPHSPLLDVPRWRDALAGAGFARVEVLDGGCEAGIRLQQHILIAEADAVQPAPPRPVPAAPRTKAVSVAGSQVESVLAELTAECLGMPVAQVDLHAPFIDLGVDSILGVELVNRINDYFALDLPKTVLFDQPDVASLAKAVATSMPAEVRASVAVPVPQPPKQVDISGIAIIGMAGRFPDAADVDEFWDNLAEGRCSLRQPPRTRWGANAQPQWRAGFLDDIDLFDPLFFNMSGLEAELSDPQQRIFLEECWNALEDAGYASAALRGARCGVYAGVAKGDYQVLLLQAGITEGPSFWGNEGSVLASRISYFLDLRGPSVAVNTACSSSLVALHLACQSLRAGECTMALAGGVYAGATENLHVLAGNAGMLSPDGVCRAFDQGANGMVPGEAVGVVVLKPLAAALRDGDRICGVIKGSGVNQDGRTNGITAPSARSQTDLECEVLERSGINPETIGYVEAHGTGTKLGDPIEFKALTDSFRRFTPQTNYCAIGSVKTNIGHAITAAGISSLIKVLLALKHGQIPPSLNFDRANEHMAIEGSPFFVNTRLRTWEPLHGAPRRAAISSFGFSGTNAHVIIEEPPVREQSARSTLPAYLLPLSARSARELPQVLNRFKRWLDNAGPDIDLGDVAYTLLVGRMHFKARAALVVRDVADLKQQLAAAVERPRVTENSVTNPAAWRAALAGSASVEADELGELARWYVAGGSFEPGDLTSIPGRHRVRLPTYPFQRKRYWIAEKAQPVAAPPSHEKERMRLIAAQVLKIDVADLDTAEPLEHYGMDSLAAIKFGTRLQAEFGSLPPDAAMTCRTIDALCEIWLNPAVAAVTEVSPEVANVPDLAGARPVARSLSQMVATGAIEPIHAAALLSVPVAILSSGLTRDQVRSLFRNEACWLNLLQTSFGRLGLFFLPLFDDELYLDEERTVRAVLDACTMAGRAGALMVALTGLIPSATGYARSVVTAAASQPELPGVTTGHAVTCSAVVLAVERILAEAGRTLEGERVGFLGAGSIGASVLMLMLRRLPHPAEILLCDVFGAEARLQELRRLMRDELGYQGTVRIAGSREGVAAEIYSSTLIVGATNVPNLLDTAKLPPGVLIVDDSAPHCFRTEDALQRFRTQGDLLFTEGGLLRLGQPVHQFYSVSDEMLASVPAEKMEAFNWIGRDDPNEIMGCMFSALLSAMYPDLEPTVGLIDWRTAERHYAKLKELGLGSAALHCEGFRLPTEAIANFRNRYSRHAVRSASR